jgi:predicted CXXCH cytochrome family protein
MGAPHRFRAGFPAIFIGIALWSAGLISCVTTNRAIVVPPQIPGATFVGSKECSTCHPSITGQFHDATHARLTSTASHAREIGCESCHGPGSAHVDSGGATGTIVNPRQSPEACFQCHLDKRGEFNLAHRHPVLAGKMSCVDCHDPHKGDAVLGTGQTFASLNDTCAKCHPAQRGPFVFEHEAVRDGCITCHNPHGSVNAKLLKVRNQALCLQCHVQQQTGGNQFLIGGVDHRNFLPRGTCWTSGCHEAVHGSHANSSLRY